MNSPPRRFWDGCRSIPVDLSEDQIVQLSDYLQLLLQENRKFNVTAIRDMETAWIRHVLDSLTLLPHLQNAQTIADVGSGGGLPGIPLAIARKDLNITLIETTGKKSRFLNRTIESLSLKNCFVLQDRAENIGQDHTWREKFDIAVARAIGPLRVMLEYMIPLVRVGGSVLAMKGLKAESELREAEDAIMLLGGGEVRVFDAFANGAEGAVLIIISKANHTPVKYPRLAGTPKRDPL